MFRERRVVFVFNVHFGKEGLLLCLFFKNKLQQQSCNFFYFQEFFPVKFFFTSAISLH